MVALFTGPMASGKTAALLAAAMLLRPAASSFTAVTSQVDTRWGGQAAIRSRNGLSLPAQRVERLCDLPLPSRGSLVVVDEAQFFPDLLPFAQRFLSPASAATLLVAGLDMDYRREPFGDTQALAAALQKEPPAGVRCMVHTFAAACTFCTPGGLCNAPAAFTQRLQGEEAGGEQVLVGDLDIYQPACATHHSPHPVPSSQWGGGR